MKRTMVVLLAVALLPGLGARQAQAQDKKIEFSLNLGAMTYVGGDADFFSDILIMVSPQLDIHLAKRLMISPEVMLGTDFQFNGVYVFPGVILNYIGKGVFAGAGIIVPIAVNLGWWGAEVDPPGLKLNLGYRGNHINLTAYLITEFQGMFSDNLIGVGVGYRF
jgi:opacity protein-like surface antigen